MSKKTEPRGAIAKTPKGRTPAPSPADVGRQTGASARQHRQRANPGRPLRQDVDANRKTNAPLTHAPENQ